MSHSLHCSAIVTIAASLQMVAVTTAATPAVSATPHLRPLTAEARAITNELLDGSATARELAEHLEQSDVIVYIRYGSFQTRTLEGRIGLLVSAPNYARFLVLELATGRSRLQQMVALAHELRHAVEIADAPTIIDARSLSAHYGIIGMSVIAESGGEMFETRAACDAAAQARHDLTSRTVRTAHDEGRENPSR